MFSSQSEAIVFLFISEAEGCIFKIQVNSCVIVAHTSLVHKYTLFVLLFINSYGYFVADKNVHMHIYHSYALKLCLDKC